MVLPRRKCLESIERVRAEALQLFYIFRIAELYENPSSRDRADRSKKPDGGATRPGTAPGCRNRNPGAGR
jgi:hypothetical protein